MKALSIGASRFADAAGLFAGWLISTGALMLDWLDRVRQSAGSILSEFNEDFWNLAGTDLFRGLSFQITPQQTT